MDVLSDVLRMVRLSGSAFFTAELSSPWALESPGADALATPALPGAAHLSSFHILVDGECLVDGAGGAPVAMAAGDVAVFPQGQVHTLRSAPGIAAARLDPLCGGADRDLVRRVWLGGGGAPARLVCGYLTSLPRFAPVFDALPAMLVVRRGSDYATVEAAGPDGSAAGVPAPSRTWLETTLRFVVSEASGDRSGAGAMLARLAEIVFVEIVRDYLRRADAGPRGWLAAVRDPQVGRALQLLHAHPGRAWTVAGLARELAMSRSALAQRFAGLLGESPMKYLVGWRMQLAMRMLVERTDSIEAVAERIGYESQAAFNRAFKRATGSPPAAWRRMAIRTLSAPGA